MSGLRIAIGDGFIEIPLEVEARGGDAVAEYIAEAQGAPPTEPALEAPDDEEVNDDE